MGVMGTNSLLLNLYETALKYDNLCITKGHPHSLVKRPDEKEQLLSFSRHIFSIVL